jgi:acyl-CoA thioesterase FadM
LVVDQTLVMVSRSHGATVSTTATFPGPVLVDRPHRVEAVVVRSDDTTITTEARIVDPAGAELVRSEATFVVVGVADITTGAGTLHDHHGDLVDGESGGPGGP